MKNVTFKVLVAVFALTFTFSRLQAQTIEEATNAYNRGVELAASDLPKAVEALTQAASIAEKAGEGAEEILRLAKQQIPVLQYNYATALYKDKKVDEAIENFELAHNYAVEYGDQGILSKADDLLPKLYRVKGNADYKAGKYDDALASFDKALTYDPDFAGAHLSKGLVYNKQNNNELLKSAMDAAIESGLIIKDDKTVEQAKKFMSDNLLIEANDAFKKNDFEKTIELLGQSLDYSDTNPEVHYLFAVAYNKLSRWDDAVVSALKGLELEEATAAKQARFHFELGMAHAGKGETGDACASFKKAAVGPLAESANYQIKTVLKCS
ncbi:MAG TPA: tetratricopeptide repeat protein [Lentimicrobium sp.]|jgi:tetratricopeptide (TPR) repeat protein|nr:tetratricopeptide repeat protein [Lentimicrobium sp.]